MLVIFSRASNDVTACRTIGLHAKQCGDILLSDEVPFLSSLLLKEQYAFEVVFASMFKSCQCVHRFLYCAIKCNDSPTWTHAISSKAKRTRLHPGGLGLTRAQGGFMQRSDVSSIVGSNTEGGMSLDAPLEAVNAA